MEIDKTLLAQLTVKVLEVVITYANGAKMLISKEKEYWRGVVESTEAEMDSRIRQVFKE